MPKAKLIAASVATKKKTSLSKRIFALVKKGVIYIVFLAVVASILLFVGVLYKRFEDIPPDDAPSSLPLREVMSASSVELQEPEGKRLLYMTASYGMEQFVFLQKSLDCMRDLCNMGWDVTLHLQVANGLNYSHPRFYEIQQQLYCIRTQAFIPLILAEYEKIGFGLNCKHRQYIAEHVDEFDYFVFAEEDMLLSVSHFAAFLASEQKLKKYLPKTWFRYFIGFLRYEDGIGGLNRVSWEYLPEKIHVVDMGSLLGKYVVTNNLNQAIYILSRFQIMDLEERCDFLSKPGNNDFYKALRRAMDMDWKYLSVGVSEWSSSFQQVLQCGMRRVVPVEHLQLFLIHHSSNIAQKRKLRKEHMTPLDWIQIVQYKAQGRDYKDPSRSAILSLPTIEHIYDKVIFEQYNMHLIDKERLRKTDAKWSWGVDKEG